jgi:methyl-accepting chemotaxis protein
LASRSQDSANDTAALIENSNSRVNDGVGIASATANALATIVDNISRVTGIIATIAEASREQADAISQVSIGLSEISQVVNTNSATAEESAAASQELNAQAEILKQSIAYFKV